MHHRVLLVIDGGGRAIPALPELAALARRWRAGVHVVHVRPGDADMGGGRAVTEAVEALRAAGVDAAGEVRLLGGRDVAGAIARIGTCAGADVVALAAPHGGLSRAAVARLELPVLFLPARAASPGRRLAAIAAIRDEIDRPAVVGAALDAVAGGPAELRMVHVASRRPPEDLCEAHRLVARALRRVAGEPSLRTSSAVLTGRGPVAEQLAGESARMAGAMVVLGSRRPSPLDALVHGSVAFDLARLGGAPVLLARPPVAELVIN